MKKLTEENVQQLLMEGSHDKTVFLYFYMQAPECEGTTTALSTAITDNNEYISLVGADVSDPVGQGVAMQLGLRTVPALIVLKEGRPVDAVSGDDVKNKLQELIKKYMPKENELLLRDALEAEARDDLATAQVKAAQAYALDKTDLQAKFIYARLLIKAKNLDGAHELLDNPGREESQSQDYKDLLSALTLAEQAQESPEIKELQQQHAANPDDDGITLKLAAALAAAGKRHDALELLFAILKADMGKAEVKKTFLDILSTMAGDPTQNEYRRKLYTLMY